MADPIKAGEPFPRFRRPPRDAPGNGLIRSDGRPIDAPPALLVPDGGKPRAAAIHLNAAPDGVMIIIGNGDVQLQDGDTLTATTVPWDALFDLLAGMTRMLAQHYPRQDAAPTE